MLKFALAATALIGLAGSPALAQSSPSQPGSTRASNIGPSTPASPIAPILPSPGLADGAGVNDFLHAARAAVLTGQTGVAQQSLEMAETRSLDRSVVKGQAATPAADPEILLIHDALLSLGGNTAETIRLIDRALIERARADSRVAG